jgi:hypothetical protein
MIDISFLIATPSIIELILSQRKPTIGKVSKLKIFFLNDRLEKFIDILEKI